MIKHVDVLVTVMRKNGVMLNIGRFLRGCLYWESGNDMEFYSCSSVLIQ